MHLRLTRPGQGVVEQAQLSWPEVTGVLLVVWTSRLPEGRILTGASPSQAPSLCARRFSAGLLLLRARPLRFSRLPVRLRDRPMDTNTPKCGKTHASFSSRWQRSASGPSRCCSSLAEPRDPGLASHLSRRSQACSCVRPSWHPGEAKRRAWRERPRAVTEESVGNRGAGSQSAQLQYNNNSASRDWLPLLPTVESQVVTCRF